MTAKDALISFKSVDCNKTYEKKFNEALSKRFENTFQFCDADINKFCLMLRKSVYPYEHVNGWKRLNETQPTKKEFYSNLSMEGITEAE